MGEVRDISIMIISKPKLYASKNKAIYCPLCYSEYKEYRMVYDKVLDNMKCPVCEYLLPKDTDAVELGKLVAGNEQIYNKPYARSVSVHKKMIPKVQDVYNSPQDAWQNDDL